MSEQFAKCVNCDKTVRGDKIIYFESGIYCSEKCAKLWHKKFKKMKGKISEASGRSHGLGRLIGFAFTIAVVWMALEFFNFIDILPFI